MLAHNWNKVSGMLRFLALVLPVFVAFEVQAATPSSADLQFDYNVDSGTLRITHTFNRTPSPFCRVTLRGLVSYEGLSSASSLRSIKTRKITKSRTLRFRVYNLRGVNANEDGLAPILTLQAKSQCKNRVVVSNSAARYITCGRGSKSVSPSSFLKSMARGIL